MSEEEVVVYARERELAFVADTFLKACIFSASQHVNTWIFGSRRYHGEDRACCNARARNGVTFIQARAQMATRVTPSQQTGAALAGTLRLGDRVVNRLGFGAMRLCGAQVWGRHDDPDNAARVLKRALDLGINFIDTADSYGPEVNESVIAEVLHPYPQGLVIATKGGLTRPEPSAWVENGHPEHLRRALDGSLKRLRVDCIDLYQLHAPDPKVPYVDSVGALAEQQRAGKIRHLGISNVTVAQLDEARRITDIVSVQNEFNVGNRADQDVLDACTRLGIAFLPWYPLGGAGDIATANVKRIARRRGITPSQVAIAWLLARSPVVLPIPGTQSVGHLEENIAAAGITLASEELEALES